VPAERILDEEHSLVESAKSERAEVDIPFAIIDLDESDVAVLQGLTDVDPLLVPADPVVATHAQRIHAEPVDLAADQIADAGLTHPEQGGRPG
jgi:hypothetical protein